MKGCSGVRVTKVPPAIFGSKKLHCKPQRSTQTLKCFVFVFYSGCCLVLKTRTVPNHFVNMILKALKKELTNEVFNTNCLLFHLSVLLLFVHFVFLADPFSFEYPPPLHTVLVHLKYFNCEYFKYFNCEYFRYFFVAYSLLPHLAREIF